MGLWERFKNRITGLRYAHMLNSGQPIFSQFGDDIYASDIVQSVVNCIVTETTKLTPHHVRRNGADRVPVNDSIQWVLNNPNPLMTRSDFMSKIVWNLFLNYNSLVYPTYENVRGTDGKGTRRYTGLYPLQPMYVDFLEDKSGELYCYPAF